VTLLEEIAAGRTDRVFDFIAQGLAAQSRDADGVSLLQWCAYYGDVSAPSASCWQTANPLKG